jgi:hypothetical protein
VIPAQEVVAQLVGAQDAHHRQRKRQRFQNCERKWIFHVVPLRANEQRRENCRGSQHDVRPRNAVLAGLAGLGDEHVLPESPVERDFVPRLLELRPEGLNESLLIDQGVAIVEHPFLVLLHLVDLEDVLEGFRRRQLTWRLQRHGREFVVGK